MSTRLRKRTLAGVNKLYKWYENSIYQNYTAAELFDRFFYCRLPFVQFVQFSTFLHLVNALWA